VALPHLALQDESPSVRQTVFAIGNPEGLEASLSQGLVSGIREARNSVVYQISAPISHGSSEGEKYGKWAKMPQAQFFAFSLVVKAERNCCVFDICWSHGRTSKSYQKLIVP